MYQDAGYGENWQPEGNNARRFNPYTRSCTVFASLFAIGLVLIIIVVLSLIPIYISRTSAAKTTNIQTSKMTVSNYRLSFLPPYDTFDSYTIISDINNRIRLQAGLTALLQKDPLTSGSVIEIGSITNKRSTRSTQANVTCSLTITNNKTCATGVCLNQYESRITKLLTNSKKSTSWIRYQNANSTIYWLIYQLPQTIASDVSYAFVDPKTIASVLTNLIVIDQTENQPSIENTTSFIL